MHHPCRAWFTLIILAACTGLVGCHSASGVAVTNYPVPGSVNLSPTPYASVEIGKTLAFTASALDSTGSTIAEPISYTSSNTAILTIASNGVACAGSWDNLTNPQVCTPGPPGVAQIAASAKGVSSPTTTVYIHQHIDKVALSIVPPPPGQSNPPGPCYSKGQAIDFQANAFSGGTDITSSVGQFSWLAVTSDVVKLATLSTSPTNLPVLNEAQATANTPGITQIYASIDATNSVPMNFTTCLVESISLQVTNSSTTSETITPTITDTLGNLITGVPLTWSSSQSGAVSVSSSGDASTTSVGGSASIIGSCTPPTCNINTQPGEPIYPQNVVTMQSSGGTTGTGGSGGSGGSSTTATTTLFVTTTACVQNGCTPGIVSVSVPGDTLQTQGSLQANPNSLVFNGAGTKAYLGTNSSLLGTAGLMVLTPGSPPSVTQYASAAGKVLAVSPDGTKVILSDTADTPNQVFIFDTGTNSPLALQISGATAADFSPDSLKAFILAGSTMYVYSKVDALKTIPLSSRANDVSFLSEGAFAYVAGGSPSSVSVFRTCDNGAADTVSGLPATPLMIRTLPDATKVLALDPPSVDLIAVNTTPVGCTPTVADTASTVNLGQGNFTPTQLIISEDGSMAYILASNLGSILAFNITGQFTTNIALAGNATPIQAALTPDGQVLYVAASDGTVHAVNLVAGGDYQQITFPANTLCTLNTVPCPPDLIAIQP